MVFPFRRLTQKEGDILMAMELKTTGVNGFVKPAELTNMETLLNAVNDELLTGKGAGSDFLGWLDLPVNYDKEEFARIQKAAKKIQSDSDVLVVIGIGGIGAHGGGKQHGASSYSKSGRGFLLLPPKFPYFIRSSSSARRAS